MQRWLPGLGGRNNEKLCSMGMGFPFGVMSVWGETEVEAVPHCDCAKCHCLSKWFALCYVTFGPIT